MAGEAVPGEAIGWNDAGAPWADDYRFLPGRVRPYRWTLALALLLMLAQSLLRLANPWLAGRFSPRLAIAPFRGKLRSLEGVHHRPC